MEIYKWRCSICGYIHTEPNGISRQQAELNKKQHIERCRHPSSWGKETKPCKDIYKEIKIVEI